MHCTIQCANPGLNFAYDRDKPTAAASRRHLLDVPSAYEMTPNSCRWIYKHEGGTIEVRSWAPVERHELNLSIEIVSGGRNNFV